MLIQWLSAGSRRQPNLVQAVQHSRQIAPGHGQPGLKKQGADDITGLPAEFSFPEGFIPNDFGIVEIAPIVVPLSLHDRISTQPMSGRQLAVKRHGGGKLLRFPFQSAAFPVKHIQNGR